MDNQNYSLINRSQTAPNPPLPSESNNPTMSKFRSKKIIFIIFLLILLTFIIPLIVYFIKISGDSKNNTHTSLSSSNDNENLENTYSDNTKATNPGWVIYTDPQYNYTIEHPKEITYKDGRFFNNKYLKSDDNYEDIGDFPYLKVTAAGAGEPKEVLDSELYVDPNTGKKDEVFYDEIKQNNWYGIKLKNPDNKYATIHYYITSDSIAPTVLNIYFFESPYFHTPSEDTRKYSEKFYQEEKKTQKEYQEMEETVSKMLSSLTFLDVKDQSSNWITHKTSDGITFKYPNTFDLEEYEKGAFEIENKEYETRVWKVYIDTRKKGAYSNYDNAVKTIKSYLQNPKEKTISGYKVFTGKIASKEAQKFFEDTSPNGMNEFFFFDSDNLKDSTNTATVGLIPYKGGAIAVYSSDKNFIEVWLDEILANVKFQ